MLEILKSATFERWFSGLRDVQAQARINARIRRLSLGNPGDEKPVGWARRGPVIALRLCGGDKRTQDADIKRALQVAKV